MTWLLFVAISECPPEHEEDSEYTDVAAVDKRISRRLFVLTPGEHEDRLALLGPGFISNL